MMLSPAGRVLTFGFMVAAMVVAAGANGYAHTHRATTKGTAKMTQSAPEPSVKLRYYGGPKSPMYP
jgi:hypothetical protein